MLRPTSRLGKFAAVVALFGMARVASADVRVFQDGNELRPSHPENLTALIVALVESSSVDSTAYAHPEESWTAASAAPTRVYAHFNPARSMKVMKTAAGFAPDAVEEILFRLGGGGFPDHILLHTAQGYRAVTKYSPCVEARIIVASGLSFPNGQAQAILENCEKH
jgi:hypothetical protein